MADLIEPFLAHKSKPWRGQNRTMLRTDTAPLRSSYYLGFIENEPVANISTFLYSEVGILGHVFTKSDHRRKGIARSLMEAVLIHFASTGGKALYLGTGFGTSAYRIYHEHGFRSIAPESGEMAYYVDTDEASFEDRYYRRGRLVSVRAFDWRDWAAFTALTMQSNGSFVRLVHFSMYGRHSMESVFLSLMKISEEKDWTKVRSLETEDGVVAGMAFTLPDQRFPGIAHADAFLHPAYEANAEELVRSATDVDAPIQAYIPANDEARIAAYEKAGFSRDGRMPDISLDAVRIGMVRMLRM